jgi:hypothetical protein
MNDHEHRSCTITRYDFTDKARQRLLHPQCKKYDALEEVGDLIEHVIQQIQDPSISPEWHEILLGLHHDFADEFSAIMLGKRDAELVDGMHPDPDQKEFRAEARRLWALFVTAETEKPKTIQ